MANATHANRREVERDLLIPKHALSRYAAAAIART